MSNSDQASFSVKGIAQQLGLEFRGDGNRPIHSVASLASATETDLCFLQSLNYLDQLQHSHCVAVIVPVDFDADSGDKSLIFAKNPHLAFVRAIHLLLPHHESEPSVHASAQLDPSVKLGQNVSIGANCVIGEGVSIADNVRIAAGCIIEQGCRIGPDTRLHAGVTLCHDVVLGADVIIQPGVVIGADGFGLVHEQGEWLKIPHLGSVRIGDKVEIGANTTIDRGALDDTVIGHGVKLDNLIQVAHNVQIGDNTAIAACVGIAGSAIIGRNCKISGAAGILGHLTIADDVTITAKSLVTKSIEKSGTYSSGTPLMENRQWHRNNARYKSLDKLAKIVTSLEKKL